MELRRLLHRHRLPTLPPRMVKLQRPQDEQLRVHGLLRLARPRLRRHRVRGPVLLWRRAGRERAGGGREVRDAVHGCRTAGRDVWREGRFELVAQW